VILHSDTWWNGKDSSDTYISLFFIYSYDSTGRGLEKRGSEEQSEKSYNQNDSKWNSADSGLIKVGDC
jgi:hypothetical protein